MDNYQQLSLVLLDVIGNNIKIEAFIADNPKRAFLRNSLQHSAKFGCEYCFECGISLLSVINDDSFLKKLEEQKKKLNEHIQSLQENTDHAHLDSLKNILNEAEKMGKKNKKSSHIVWPASTMNGEERTKEKVIAIVDQIEEGIEMSQSDKKGIKGKSLLLDIDYFEYVTCLPTEYMHLVCLGIVKRMLELSFSVGETRSRNINRPLTPPTLFDEAMKNVKVFKECSRRARKMDLAVMKAQEYRNCLIFFFPIITKCLENSEKEIKAWEMLAFMIRACILPNEEYSNVNENHIKYCLKTFYVLYQQLYGEKNCTYSVHVMCSHLPTMRKYGPLTETSAFRFESFYAELRRSFQPGTTSVVKQMLQTVMLKRMLSKHVCREAMYLSAKDTALECNSLIYIFTNNTYVIYKIMSIEHDTLTCNQLGNHEVEFPTTSMLSWSSVGVFRKGGLSSINVAINRKDVTGKVLKVDRYLITCPINILREK